MRRTIVLVLVAALAVLTLAGCSTPTATGGAVEIKEFAFVPASVQVAVGGAVTWTNADAVTHTVKGEGWGSGDLAKGATFSNTFDTAGTFAYSCGVHPSMTGSVIVK